MTGRRLLSPLGVRLAVAFVAVAVAAVAVLAGLTVVSARDQVSSLITDVHAEDARAAADAAAHAYERAGGWRSADLTNAAAIAARGQAELMVLDVSGDVVAAPARDAAEMMARMHGIEILEVDRGDPVTHPVVVDGRSVGAVALRFPTSHILTPEYQIRDALIRNVWLGAGLAVLSAIAVAVLVARVVSRPITALTAAATDVERGVRNVRVNLGDAPGELGALAASFDRMAAAVDEQDRLRRQLVADVAHEVRTPLTILRGTTEALVDGIAPADQDTLASLHDEVLRLGRLVADLETLAAADAAGLQLERQPLDLGAEVAAVLELIRPIADANELILDHSLAPAPVRGDQRRIRQILTALLANSTTYTPAGGTVTVTTSSDGTTSTLRVEDTGPGIDPADLPHVFDRFYRGSRTAGTIGTGIGLAVARDLVHAHAGTISIANRSPRGTRTTVTLPSPSSRPGDAPAHY